MWFRRKKAKLIELDLSFEDKLAGIDDAIRIGYENPLPHIKGNYIPIEWVGTFPNFWIKKLFSHMVVTSDGRLKGYIDREEAKERILDLKVLAEIETSCKGMVFNNGK